MNASVLRLLVPRTALLAALAASPAAAQFDQFIWTYSDSGSGSGSVTSDKMIIYGPEDGDGCFLGATNAFTTVAPYSLVVIADFDIVNWDKGGSDFDYLVTIVNGEETTVSGSCFDCQVVLYVPAGATFGFGVHSTDCKYGAAIATLSPLLVQAAPDVQVINGSQPESHFGAALAVLDDLDGDGIREVAVGAPWADAGAGRVTMHVGSNYSVIQELVGAATNDHFGAALAAVGDLDGDGVGELLVGAPDSNLGGQDSGAASIHSGSTGQHIATLAGETVGDLFGTAVASAGDLDGDGLDDLLIGAPRHDGAGIDAGRATVHAGGNGLVIRSWSGAAGDRLGEAVASVGDIDGDGVPDVAVGSPRADTVATDSGRAQVFSGATGTELLVLSEPGCSPGTFAFFGSAVAGIGDVDGDGVPDLAVGAPGDNCGSGVDGSAVVFSGAEGHALSSMFGSLIGPHLGSVLAAAGDVNDDGRPDLLVGSDGTAIAPDEPGRVHLFTAIDGGLLLALVGNSASEQLGAAVASAGDTNGDGRPDILVGAPSTDASKPGSLFSVRPSFLWTDVGHALAGTLGPASLQAQGLLAEGTPVVVTLAETESGLPVTLVVGLAELGAPFKGGVLVPQPNLLVAGLVSTSTNLVLGGTAPPGMPSGIELFVQAWIVDAAGPKGLAASNAVRGTVP